jgi:hypothetical protein
MQMAWNLFIKLFLKKLFNMGKKIIVKGADFSENAIYQDGQQADGWLVTNYTTFASALTYAANVDNGGWAFIDEMSNLRGKKINKIRFKASASGDFPILVGTACNNLLIVRIVSVSSSEVGSVVEKTFDELLVANTQLIGIGKANGAGFYYAQDSGHSFYSKIPDNPTLVSGYVLGIDIGYFNSQSN